MDEKEFRTLKARIAYRQYVESLPKCEECKYSYELMWRKNTVTACSLARRIIDGRVTTCPTWCPFREEVTNGREG